jgi:hypothetical protein
LSRTTHAASASASFGLVVLAANTSARFGCVCACCDGLVVASCATAAAVRVLRDLGRRASTRARRTTGVRDLTVRQRASIAGSRVFQPLVCRCFVGFLGITCVATDKLCPLGWLVIVIAARVRDAKQTQREKQLKCT